MPEDKSTKSRQVIIEGDVAKVFVSYDIKMSYNYQTAGCSFGITLPVANSKRAIEKGFERIEKMCEVMLTEKIGEITHGVIHLSETAEKVQKGEITTDNYYSSSPSEQQD